MYEKSVLQESLEGQGIKTCNYLLARGESCLGVYIDDDETTMSDLLEAAVLAADDDDERRALAREFSLMKTNSMGRGTIAYWPRIARI